MKLFYLLSLFGIGLINGQITATKATQIKEALAQKQEMASTSLVKNIPLTNIGPSIMSGRVVDIAVHPNNPIEFFVGYASGGLWYTNNNGASFTPVLDGTNTQNVGDIAVDWNSGTIWVGTGENNSSRSSYAGIGILKSIDFGKTWENVGLLDSHHIGRIIINPKNPNEVIVGVTGHLYSTNSQRGIYKTTDGGLTWKNTLFINEATGIIDLAYAPNNFNILYAAAWQKDRKAWNFSGNGKSSGIYKSTDGGTSWNKVSVENSGLPTGNGVGRIGLAVYDENTVYAVIDNQEKRVITNTPAKQLENLVKDDFKRMTPNTFLKLSNNDLNTFLKNNHFQEKYNAENLKQMVKNGSVQPTDVATYAENANSILFDTPVVGAEVYRSTNGGTTWHKQNTAYIDDLFYSYGYYFAQINVDPNNVNKIYLAGVPLLKSEDGGKTFTSIHGDNVHADHHALWINPKMEGHLINGNDGGLNISYDDGDHWIKNNTPTVGQFYAINVDNQEPYHVYGGLQDNGVWKGPHNADENTKWHQTGDYPWKRLLGGDGMQVQVDNRNPNVVYTGYQFGNYYRINLENDKRFSIQPQHNIGESPYRFNWQTPILLSSHNQDILYLGSNKLHRSMNQGDDWELISPDLTKNDAKGNVTYGTLTTLSESAFTFGLLYTGSDDGLVQITKDNGTSWHVLSSTLPKNMWVSRVVASKHKKERVYVCLNGYRWDDFTPYIYRSEDYGKTWKSISNNIPLSPVNVIIEDPENESLLFAGTDNGLYVSFNKGNSWQVFQNGMPNVAVHDLVIQNKEKHLLIGTHGRSIYKADISKLQQMNEEIRKGNLHVFDVEDLKHSEKWGNTQNAWSKPRTPGIDINFYSNNTAEFTASIKTADDIEVSSTELIGDKGINILSFDVAFSKAGKNKYLKKHKALLIEAKDGKTYLPKGSYTVEIKGNGAKESKTFKIE